MKFLKLLPICIVLLMVACKNEPKIDANGTVTPGTTTTEQKAEEPARPLSAIEIKADTYDFGKIKDGAVVEHVFKFKNIGKNDLVLKDVKASCGCTTPTWPKEPIAPGAEGEIKAAFNSTGKSSGSGEVMKTITITANTDPGQSFLYIKGTVTPSEEKK
jgi:hypothetical protein